MEWGRCRTVASHMDARGEAVDRVGGRYDARVLEPSPPAVATGDALADDPVAAEERPTGAPLLVPFSPGTTDATTWHELAAADDLLSEWCAARWLATWPALPPVPSDLPATRVALHAVAERVVSPARHAANGKIGLRYTRGGFGTPFFRSAEGRDRQVRVDETRLVIQTDDQEETFAITTLGELARAVGVPEDATTGVYEPTTDVPPAAALEIEAGAAAYLGTWFGFAASVLEQLRAEAAPSDRPSRVQLWPEHFDLAVEIGPDATRGTFGFSPGDEAHPEPYVYVTHWNHVAPDRFWNDAAGAYASRSLSALRAEPDHREAALAFCRDARRILQG
jgi:hypothetical protein